MAVEKLSPKDASNDLAAYAAQLRQRIEAEVSGFSADPVERAKRLALGRTRCRCCGWRQSPARAARSPPAVAAALAQDSSEVTSP